MSSHSNASNYESLVGGYMQPVVENTYLPYNEITSDPNALQMVINPYDKPYKVAIDAFRNKGLLNPNQDTKESLSRNYYTLGSAYGETPGNTQISRTCSGNVIPHRLSPQEMTAGQKWMSGK
jgi:hypothetical protein